MTSALAYAPRRQSPLGRAAAGAAAIHLWSFAAVLVRRHEPDRARRLCARGRYRGWRRARAALAPAARWGAMLGILIVAVNALASQRGDTILVRGPEVPVLGTLDITAEALAEGAVLALRITIVFAAFAVHTACVDPDRLMRLARPLARRSALTATLIARLAPLAAADHARVSEAAALRGPGAAPVGRVALLRRLVSGSLDRAVDVAATLELRGYAGAAPGRAPRRPRAPGDLAFALSGLGALGLVVTARLAGLAGYESYPQITIDTGAATLALAAALPAAAPSRSASTGSGPAESRASLCPLSRRSSSPASRTATREGPGRRCATSTCGSSRVSWSCSGRSGSGKTTLLRAACGLIPHFHGGDVAGTARILGLDLARNGPAELGALVGMVAQEPETQVVSATVRGELELPLEIRGEAARPRTRGRGGGACTGHRASARASHRIALRWRAPTGRAGGHARVSRAADPARRADLAARPGRGRRADRRPSQAERRMGATILIAEHRLERCLAAADRVVAFAEGRLRFDGPPGAFLESTVASDPALATPAATLFDGLGIRPLPVGVKAARTMLAERGISPPNHRTSRDRRIATVPGRSQRRRSRR